MTAETTPYPAYGGPRSAKHLRQKAEDYRGEAEELRAELDAAERAFGGIERVSGASDRGIRLRVIGERAANEVHQRVEVALWSRRDEDAASFRRNDGVR